jgi:hypothetical protein
MRRLLPLTILTLLAVPANAQAARWHLVKPHSTDAAATKALSRFAVKLEACRSRTIDYHSCADDEVRDTPYVRYELYDSHNYAVYARAKTGRRFRLERAAVGKLTATCSPKGRGACGRRGTWKPAPMPVMNPAPGTEWLAHERELVVRLLALTEVIDRCYASTGDFTRCRTDEMEAARRWEMLWGPPGANGFTVDLQEQDYMVSGTSRASTRFVYVRSPRGVERWCDQPNPRIETPCAGGGW